jgi:uncharacterized membrane protein
MSVIQALRKANRLHETIFLVSLALLCAAASVFRCIITKSIGFIFLNWNLFLAFVPWILTSILITKNIFQKSKIAVIIIMPLWLLFFPNAPYVITDLLHLHKIRGIPVWYDLLMILTYSWTSMLAGFQSLWDIEKILAQKINYVAVKICATVLLFIASFGIYIGRYLRWNSWDIIIKPGSILSDIAERFISPFEHQTTWGMTIFMGIFLNIVYWSLELVKRRVGSPNK